VPLTETKTIGSLTERQRRAVAAQLSTAGSDVDADASILARAPRQVAALA
jgi:hypothetical protein